MKATELPTIEKRVQLSAEVAARLAYLAQVHHTSEGRLIEKALDILFSLTEMLDGDERAERQGWSYLSAGSLQRVWDNADDALYDDWRALYGVPVG